MSINYGPRIVADVAIRQISGSKGVGINLLRFSVVFTRTAWPNSMQSQIECRNFRARVFVGRPREAVHALGWAVPESLLTLAPTEYSQQQALLFDLDLAHHQLHAIEELRSGGDLHFEVHFSGDSQGPQGSLQVFDVVQYRVNVSDWSNVIRQLGYADILVIGVEVPSVDIDSPLSHVVQNVLRANDSLHKGQYDVAVGQCRHAIESLQKIEGERTAVVACLNQFQTARAKMSKRERERFLGEAVRHYTHLAHHVGDEGDIVNFSRADATAVIAMTISAISHAMAREKADKLATLESPGEWGRS